MTPRYVVPGITYSDVSRGTGLHVSTISRVLSGRRQPQLRTAQRICNYISAIHPSPFSIGDLQKLIAMGKPHGRAA